MYLVAAVAAVHNGAPPLRDAWFDALPGEFILSHLAAARFMAANMLSAVTFTFSNAAGSFFLLVSLRRLLRNQWFAVAGFCLLFYLWTSNQPQFRGEWLILATSPILLAVWILITLRYGLLTLAIMVFAYQIIAQSVLTSDFGAWYSRSSLIAVLLVSALATWAFRVSIGSRPLWPSAREWRSRAVL